MVRSVRQSALRGLAVQPFCRIDPVIAEIAMQMPAALERIGVSHVYARMTAIHWLKYRLRCPLIIAACMYECIAGEQCGGCSHGNTLCGLLER